MTHPSIKERFREILLQHNFPQHYYLLAISGGVDSMILLNLFRESSAKFQVAHCNFQLRGDDAIRDEEFVRDYCAKHTIPFHSVKFDVEVYQKTGNYSVEMACRNLRYDWFKEVQKVNNLDYLVTAHHLDDNLETFIINLSRGTGLKGLVGMQIDNGKIFRPLLEFTKSQLIAYAQENNLDWKEDYTNETDDYTRNKIRHHISPILKEIHPQFNTNFLQTLEFLNDNQQIIAQQIQLVKTSLFKGENPIRINVDELKKLNPLASYLHYLFESYGFLSTKELIKFLDSNTGSEIKSDTYRLIKDRNDLLLISIKNSIENEIQILDDFIEINSLNLKFVKSKNPNEYATEIVDFTTISFPLKLRKVREGDFFYPIGMGGKKKLVNKFMKDLKLSKLEKENVWLLCDQNDQIIWIVNHRLDERFKTTQTSKNFLNITLC